MRSRFMNGLLVSMAYLLRNKAEPGKQSLYCTGGVVDL